MKTVKELFMEACNMIDERSKHSVADTKLTAAVELTKLLADDDARKDALAAATLREKDRAQDGGVQNAALAG